MLAAVRAGLVLARRAGRATAAAWGWAKRHAPKWLVPVLAVCAFVPGPFDEVLVIAVVLVPVLRSRDARAEFKASVSAAWRGEGRQS